MKRIYFTFIFILLLHNHRLLALSPLKNAYAKIDYSTYMENAWKYLAEKEALPVWDFYQNEIFEKHQKIEEFINVLFDKNLQPKHLKKGVLDRFTLNLTEKFLYKAKSVYESTQNSCDQNEIIDSCFIICFVSWLKTQDKFLSFAREHLDLKVFIINGLIHNYEYLPSKTKEIYNTLLDTKNCYINTHIAIQLMAILDRISQNCELMKFYHALRGFLESNNIFLYQTSQIGINYA